MMHGQNHIKKVLAIYLVQRPDDGLVSWSKNAACTSERHTWCVWL